MNKNNKKQKPKYRALELYARDTPFKPKVVQNKKAYRRKNYTIKNVDY